MILAVASGKGGTGKTTVAASLARVAGGVTLLDCDVEEPNLHLFFEDAEQAPAEVVTVPLPEVDEARCDSCGECARFCEFKALAVLAGRVLVFPELCHSCGGCKLVCPRQAIREVPRRIGVIETRRARGVRLLQGRLDVGVPTAPPLIKVLQKRIPASGNAILDAPPGTSCPVVTTLRVADYTLLVTEPTPFGLHDLRLAVAVARAMRLNFGVVVNRATPKSRMVHDYCGAEGIPLLAEIPDDRRIAEAYSRGDLLIEALPEYRDLFVRLWERVSKQNAG